MIKSYVTLLFVLLHRYAEENEQINNTLIESELDLDKIKKAIQYINNNYTKKILLEDIAQRAYMNPTYFSFYFKKVMNITVTDYIMNLRVKHAAYLLTYTYQKISEIYKESGFKSKSNFNRYFRKITNLSPDEFRKKTQSYSE